MASNDSECHSYIHNVLNTGDHGPHRHIIVDSVALNDAIDEHKEKIVPLIRSDVVNALPGDGDEPRVTVQNDLGNISFQCVLKEPANLDELVQVIAKAKRKNMSVKAVGTMHSWSPICETNGYLIKTDKLAGVSRTPTTTIKSPFQSEELFNVLGGTKLQAVCDALEKDGRALMNLGGFTGQSIIGATATGTHGSGLTLQPLASMIRSVHLVSAKFDTNGQPIQYRIEPADGITDPKLHPATPVLIQDDQTFNAVVTGLGAFGVVYAVTIATVPFYWIKETREKVEWPKARKLLEDGPQGDILKYHNCEVWINPYTSDALITRREVVTTNPDGQLAGRNEDAFAALVRELPALRSVAEAIKGRPGSITDDISFEVGATLGAFLKNFPLLVPTAINIALGTQNHSEPKTAKYYDIYDIGFANFFPVVSAEISFPLTTNLPATDAAIDLLKKLHHEDLRKALTGFLSLRFTASTPATVSMSFSADKKSTGRCYLEIFSLFKFFESIQGYDELLAPLSKQSIDQFQGRLHWGQYLTPSFSTLQYKARDPEFFENIQQFKAIAEKFDPGHLMANGFLNNLVGVELKGKDKGKVKATFLSRLGGFFRRRKSAKSKSR